MAPIEDEPRPSRLVALSGRQLSLLHHLAELRSVRRAADAMHITQPAATALLKQLEAHLGSQLFERHSRGMRPTPSGEVMIRYARGMRTELRGVVGELQALRSGATGRVRLGSVMGAVPGLLAPGLARFKASHPGVELSLQVSTSNVLMQALAAGDLDLMLGRVPSSAEAEELGADLRADLDVQPLMCRERLCIVARAGHPLFQQHALQLQDLLALTWIVHPPGSPLRLRLDAALQRLNFTGRLDRVETASLLATTALLVESDMVSVVSEDIARHYAQSGMLGVVPVAFPFPMSDILVIRRLSRPLGRAAQALLEELGAGTGPGEPGAA